jgi:hypothetical protein
MDTTVLAFETKFEVTNIGQHQRLSGMQISFNRDMIDLSKEVFVDKILERFQMNNSHPTLLPMDPNTRLPQKDSVLEAEPHGPYQLDYRIMYVFSNLNKT